MSLLTAADIASVQDFKYVDVDMPQWGGTVRLRNLTADALDEYNRSLFTPQGDKFVPNAVRRRLKLVSQCFCDERGDVDAKANIEALSKRDGTDIDTLYEAAAALNKLTQASREEIAKNSEATPGSATVTA